MQKQLHRTGLYTLFLRRLQQAQEVSKKEIIPFPVVFEKLCRNFTITKEQCWDILFMFHEIEMIEIITGHGVRMKMQIDQPIS